MTETVIIKRCKDNKLKKMRHGHHSRNYNELGSNTPPLSEANKHSIAELIKQRKSLKEELGKISEVIEEKPTKKKRSNPPASSILKKQQLINEKLNKISYDDLDSENEDMIINQRRQKRKLFIEQFNLTPSDETMETVDSSDNDKEDSNIKTTIAAIQTQSEDIPDMFSEFDNFKTKTIISLPNLKKSSNEPVDNWDDTDGYYKIIIGDIINDQYIITSVLGQGVFANVVRAKCMKTKTSVAIKIVRQNDLIYQTSLKEVNFLKEIREMDPTNRYHCCKLIENFRYRGHLCIVLEVCHMNLRSTLKVYGKRRGLKLKAVRCFSMQLLKALRFLKRLGIIHCDVKPDNILVNEKNNVIKLCDFGSASKIDDNECTPYLVSRFYRAPEIILGVPFDYSVDIWSAACTIYEMATGKILFTGSSNNQMLKAMMDIKGKFPSKFVRRGKFKSSHFNVLNNFMLYKKYESTGKERYIEIVTEKPTKDFLHELCKCAGDTNVNDCKLYQLKDLLESMTIFDPKLRFTASDAYTHPFIQEPFL